MSHANAVLIPKGRLRLARCIVEDRWPLARAAVGQSFNLFKQWRGIASRYDKLSLTYRAASPFTHA